MCFNNWHCQSIVWSVGKNTMDCLNMLTTVILYPRSAIPYKLKYIAFWPNAPTTENSPLTMELTAAEINYSVLYVKAQVILKYINKNLQYSK